MSPRLDQHDLFIQVKEGKGGRAEVSVVEPDVFFLFLLCAAISSRVLLSG